MRRGKGVVHPSRNTVGYCFEARWPISYRPYVDGHGGGSTAFLYTLILFPSFFHVSVSCVFCPSVAARYIYTGCCTKEQTILDENFLRRKFIFAKVISSFSCCQRHADLPDEFFSFFLVSTSATLYVPRFEEIALQQLFVVCFFNVK